MPWIFSRDFAVAIVIVLILTLFVYFARSRVAAILLLVVFIYNRLIFLFCCFFSTTPQLYNISFVCITLIWGLILIYGIKATFVYDRFKGQQPAIPENDGK